MKIVTMYVADNGTAFDSEEKCRAYEEQLKKQEKAIVESSCAVCVNKETCVTRLVCGVQYNCERIVKEG